MEAYDGEIAHIEGDKVIRDNIVLREKGAWKERLGMDVDVPPLPEHVTLEVIESFRNLGFQVCYQPPLFPGQDPDKLRANDNRALQSAVDNIPSKTGGVTKSFIPDQVFADPTGVREFEQGSRGVYWHDVLRGNVPFPDRDLVEGRWVAVETKLVGDYHQTPEATDANGFLREQSRSQLSASEAVEYAKVNGSRILETVGLPPETPVEVPGVVPLYLLGTRFDGAGAVPEMTGTVRNSGEHYWAGTQESGGYSHLEYHPAEQSGASFRLLVDLGSR